MIRQQEKNVSADTKALTDLKDSLATMFPDKNKREQAERRIQHATNRSRYQQIHSQRPQAQTSCQTGLKFIPTPPVPASDKSLLRDFQVFTRYMRLQYIFADSAGKPHPFHVKSNWQPPPQPSVALESYLERTKFEIASITFSNEKDNLSARQRAALKTLSANKEINLKKADKGTTTVIMDTRQKYKKV